MCIAVCRVSILGHQMLIDGSYILEAEGHFFMGTTSTISNESHFRCINGVHENLMVPLVEVQETKVLIFDSNFDLLICK